MNPSDEYKLTDLDYLVGDHHLQMIKAALPYLNVTEQRAVSLFVKFQELRRTFELFENEEVAAMGICSLEQQKKPASIRDLLKAIRPYGNPEEQDLIDMAQTFMDGQTPMDQLRRFLTPQQQSRFETMQMPAGYGLEVHRPAGAGCPGSSSSLDFIFPAAIFFYRKDT